VSILIAPDGAYAKEATKWEAQHTPAGPPGRPYQYYPYPAMLYRAGRINHGPIGIVETEVAVDADAAKAMKSRGFHVGPHEAIAAFEDQQVEFAKLAAERNYDVKNRLSEKACAEVAQAEDVHGSEHLPAMPETPIKRTVTATEATLAKQRANQAAKDSI